MLQEVPVVPASGTLGTLQVVLGVAQGTLFCKKKTVVPGYRLTPKTNCIDPRPAAQTPAPVCNTRVRVVEIGKNGLGVTRVDDSVVI
ncbi:hypothetical protein PCANC_12678 [Puccinia coronata f. sp. avenae]|uniref:Uncharacterized protein n=1 Tax=Puccinia coronata f. sp. avenae TaxID=200324 RepID=A0A2N5SY77_9BASI|nr:hypothetical protein PCANC_12678 [Puccinia coronata f. sp. avenae]